MYGRKPDAKNWRISIYDFTSCRQHFSVPLFILRGRSTIEAEKGFFPCRGSSEIIGSTRERAFLPQNAFKVLGIYGVRSRKPGDLLKLTGAKYRKLFLAFSLTNQFDSTNYYLSANSISITWCAQDGCFKEQLGKAECRWNVLFNDETNAV